MPERRHAYIAGEITEPLRKANFTEIAPGVREIMEISASVIQFLCTKNRLMAVTVEIDETSVR